MVQHAGNVQIGYQNHQSCLPADMEMPESHDFFGWRYGLEAFKDTHLKGSGTAEEAVRIVAGYGYGMKDTHQAV